ncbi:uncharacterized protein BT62DRAFT_842516, partial [Guyanagaster necrorhizus]
PAGRCTAGPIRCGNSVQTASSASVAALLALLGVIIQDLKVPVGLTCDPTSTIGVG